MTGSSSNVPEISAHSALIVHLITSKVRLLPLHAGGGACDKKKQRVPLHVYQNALTMCPEVEICPRLSYKHKLKSSLPHPFLCSKIHFQILSLSFLSKSFTQLHSDFLKLFNLTLVYYSIFVYSNVCLVSKRSRNQRNSVMSKLSVTSPSAPLVKSQNWKKKF